jgi:hypothetical protein
MQKQKAVTEKTSTTTFLDESGCNDLIIYIFHMCKACVGKWELFLGSTKALPIARVSTYMHCS